MTDPLQWSFGYVGPLNLWHPATWWSFLGIDWAFENKIQANYCFNLLLHGVNCGLFAHIVGKASGSWKMGIVAGMILAIHPVSIQSFAWISERKGLLANLGMLAYFAIAARSFSRDQPLLLIAAVAFLSLALLSKPTAVVAPVLLLIYLSMVKGREVKEFFAGSSYKLFWIISFVLPVAALSVALTSHASGGLMNPRPSDELGMMSAVVDACIYYLRGAFLLHDNSFLVRAPLAYGLPRSLFFLGIVLMIAIALWLRDRRCFALFLAGFVSLSPCLAIGALNPFHAADRYAYLATSCICLSVIVLFFGRLRLSRHKMAALLSLVFVVLCVRSHVVVQRYHDSITLFSGELERSPRSTLPPVHLAAALREKGRMAEALSVLEGAEQAFFGNYLIHINIADLNVQMGKKREAISHYEIASASKRATSRAFFNQAAIYGELGETRLARAAVSLGLQRFPEDAALLEIAAALDGD